MLDIPNLNLPLVRGDNLVVEVNGIALVAEDALFVSKDDWAQTREPRPDR